MLWVLVQKLVNYYLRIEEVKYLSDQGCIIIYWREKMS